MNIYIIGELVGMWDTLPYFWQATLFMGGWIIIAGVLMIVVSLLTTIRILAEGIASFISLGRLTFDETTEESYFKLPNPIDAIRWFFKPQEAKPSPQTKS